MKNKLILLASLSTILASCGSTSATKKPSCEITLDEGGTAKAYKDGSVLGEATSNSPLSLKDLTIGETFTLKVSVEEGYSLKGCTLNGKSVKNESLYFSIKIEELTNDVHVSFDFIETKAEDFTFALDEASSSATITGYSSIIPPTPLIIPSEVEKEGKKYTVSKIAKEAFANSEITKVSIPSSIESIECGAFNSAYSLQSIEVDTSNANYSSCEGVLYTKNGAELHSFPAKYTKSSYSVLPSATSIAPYSFYSNRAIESIAFNEGLASIGESAFYNVTTLKSLSFPASLKSIGSNAFYQNSSLATISFLEGLEEIGDSAFYGSLKITSLAFPKSLKRIGGNAFFKCDRLSTVTFSEGLEEIGELAFSNLTNLTSLSFPSSLKKIGNSAFSVCDKLVEVSFKEGLEEIGNSAFALCSLIRSIHLPKSLKTIGSNPFYAVLKLDEANFSIDEDNPYYTISEGVLYTKDFKKLICYPYGKDDASYEVPSGVEELSVYSFRLVDALATISLPSSIKKLDECFYEMTSSLTVNYDGTIAEFNAIDTSGSHDESWKQSSRVKVVCSDGEIA